MRKWLIPTVAVSVVLLGVGLWAFEPWRLFTSSTIDEADPLAGVSSTQTPAPGEGVTADDAAVPGGGEATEKPDAREEPEADEPFEGVLSEGEFEDAEHPTSGSAKVIQLANGDRFVRFEDLDSDDGPDLHIWVTDQPSGGDWGSYDDGRYVKLGELKATNGNQNYEIPADADLDGMKSVVIWCDRFNVAFGTAPISL